MASAALPPSLQNTIAELAPLLARFEAPVRFAAAYGSAVLPQGASAHATASHTDLILGVTHPEHWHSLNLRSNAQDYAFLPRACGAGLVSRVQEMGAARVYYNTGIRVGDRVIKYGVTSIDNLMADCAEWNALYLAGRLQKPTLTLRSDARVELAQRKNLRSAVRTALLLLPPVFTELVLYETIAQLSYAGDVRVAVGAEHPRKVHNIVRNQFHLFRSLYLPIVDNLPDCTLPTAALADPELKHILDPSILPIGAPIPEFPNNGAIAPRTASGDPEETNFAGYEIQQNVDDVEQRYLLFLKLPKNLQASLRHECRVVHNTQYPGILLTDPRSRDEALAMLQPNCRESFAGCVRHTIRSIVSWPATVQTLKGIFTAGPIRSIAYASAKFRKGMLN